jgi:hypothetical protein
VTVSEPAGDASAVPKRIAPEPVADPATTAAPAARRIAPEPM